MATFRGVDWGGQAGPFTRVNVRSHPSAPARWEWEDRCRHSVKRSRRTVQLTVVRETSRNDGGWRCWDGGLQTPENSSFGYFTDLIFILQILIFILQIFFYFTDFSLQFLFYRFYFTWQISFWERVDMWEEFRNVNLPMTWVWLSWGDPVWLTGH